MSATVALLEALWNQEQGSPRRRRRAAAGSAKGSGTHSHEHSVAGTPLRHLRNEESNHCMQDTEDDSESPLLFETDEDEEDPLGVKGDALVSTELSTGIAKDEVRAVTNPSSPTGNLFLRPPQGPSPTTQSDPFRETNQAPANRRPRRAATGKKSLSRRAVQATNPASDLATSLSSPQLQDHGHLSTDEVPSSPGSDTGFPTDIAPLPLVSDAAYPTLSRFIYWLYEYFRSLYPTTASAPDQSSLQLSGGKMPTSDDEKSDTYGLDVPSAPKKPFRREASTSPSPQPVPRTILSRRKTLVLGNDRWL